MRIAVLLLLAFVGGTFAVVGFDGIAEMSVATMECMKNDRYMFYIGRVYRSNGAIDTTGIQNIKNARAAGIDYVDAYIFPCHTEKCGSAKSQVQAADRAIKDAEAVIGMMWMDIERYNWGTDIAANRQFVLDLISEAQELGLTVGIYSGISSWKEIVGEDWTGVKDLPLWWPDFNGEESFDSFTSYGGWTKPNMHQFEGDVNGPCGVQIDKTWYP